MDRKMKLAAISLLIGLSIGTPIFCQIGLKTACIIYSELPSDDLPNSEYSHTYIITNYNVGTSNASVSQSVSPSPSAPPDLDLS